MKKITVSAPGKLMLLGEHAVVYNNPCLVTAIGQRIRLTMEVLNSPEFHLDAPDVAVSNYKKQIKDIGKGEIPKGAKFIETAIKNILAVIARIPIKSGDEAIPYGLRISTKSDFSSQYGFGSSSASVVCAVKALSEIYNLNLTPKEIFDHSYKTVLDVQGAGSGFDVAAAVYGGTVYFVTGGKIIELLAINHLPLVVAYSGIKADTVTLINQVKEKNEKYPKIINDIYSSIEKIVEEAKIKLQKKNWRYLGELMNINQGYLDALGVSNNSLSNMIYAARSAGAYGAKLSGAGGGDCIIALVDNKKRKAVEKAIEKVGGKIIPVQANAQGVKIE